MYPLLQAISIITISYSAFSYLYRDMEWERALIIILFIGIIYISESINKSNNRKASFPNPVIFEETTKQNKNVKTRKRKSKNTRTG